MGGAGVTMAAEDIILSAEPDLLDRLVRAMREQVSAKREAFEVDGRVFDRDDERRLASSVAHGVMRQDRQARVERGEAPLARPEEDRLVAEAMTQVFGVGKLASLMGDPDLWEINVNGPGQVFANSLTRGKFAVQEQIFASNQDIIDWVTHVGLHMQRSGSRSWDTTKGTIECQLYAPDDPGAHNARIVAVQGANEECQMSIRLMRNRDARLEDFVQWRSCTRDVADLIAAAVKAHLNILLVGQTGSGKTTMARAMLGLIPPVERVFVIEHFTELGGALTTREHPDSVSWQEREGNVEGAGELSLDDLVSITRRFNPDRIIVGECMGPEVVPFLRALTQGNDGGFTTLHARGLHQVAPRLVGYAAEAGLRYDVAQPLLGMGIDLMIFFEMDDGGPDQAPKRWISQIAEFDYDGQQLRLNVMYDSVDGYEAVPVAPLSDQVQRRLERVGWQPRFVGGGYA